MKKKLALLLACTMALSLTAVSYTHLDVYKRQRQPPPFGEVEFKFSF